MTFPHNYFDGMEILVHTVPLSSEPAGGEGGGGEQRQRLLPDPELLFDRLYGGRAATFWLDSSCCRFARLSSIWRRTRGT